MKNIGLGLYADKHMQMCYCKLLELKLWHISNIFMVAIWNTEDHYIFLA